MCYVHSSSDRYQGHILTGDQWIRLIDEAVEAGMLYATLTGGECFLHPDFWKIYTHLKEKGVFVTLFSNGTLLDEEWVDRLSKMRPNGIKISVYGSNPQEYYQVNAALDCFRKVDHALDLLYEAKILPSISITVSKFNSKYFQNILQYVKSKHYHRLMVDCDMIEPRKETDKNFAKIALNREEQEQVWRTYFEEEGKIVQPLCDADFNENSNLLDEKSREEYLNHGVPCMAGQCMFFIQYDGCMRPCVQFGQEKIYPLKIGFGPTWNKINEQARNYRRRRNAKIANTWEYVDFVRLRISNIAAILRFVIKKCICYIM